MNKLYKISALLSCAVLSLFFSMDVYAQETDPIVKRTPVWEHYWWPCTEVLPDGTLNPVIYKNFRFSLEEEHASGAKEDKFILSLVNQRMDAGEGIKFIVAPSRNFMGFQTFTAADLAGVTRNDIIERNYTDFGDEWAKCTKMELIGSSIISGNDMGYFLWEFPVSDVDLTVRENDYRSFDQITTQSDYQPLFEVVKGYPDKNIVYFVNAFYRCDFFIKHPLYPNYFCNIILYLSVPKAAIWYDNNLYYQPDDEMRPTISYEMTNIPHGKEYIIAKKLKASMSMEYLGLPMFSRTDFDIYITPPTDPELIKLARKNGWMD